MPWSDWSMRPAGIQQIVDEIAGGRRSILELGAGVSTVLAARESRQADGRLVSVEHDAEWAAIVEGLLRREGLDDVAQVVHVPLTPLSASIAIPAVAGLARPNEWYDIELVRAACSEEIDLLVVDGPPAGHSPTVMVRAPAISLSDLLAASFAVVMDDISRGAERRIAELWREALGGELSIDEAAGVAVLRNQLTSAS